MEYIMNSKLDVLLNDLKKKISLGDFELWFKSSHFDLSEIGDNGILSIICPAVYVKENLKNKFLDVIKDSAEIIFGKEIWIEFKVDHKLHSFKTNTTADSDDSLFELELKPPEDNDSDSKKNKSAEENQITIFKEINLNPKNTFENFVVGDSNQFARAAAWAVATNPGKQFNPLFIYGGSGLGKTHLMQAIGHYVIKAQPRLKVLYITSEEFTNKFINALTQKKLPLFREKFIQIDLLLIDDIQFLVGKEQTQEVFFHTFNSLHSSGRQLVISSDKPPKELSSFEDRLRNRMEWGLQADIQPPKFETRLAILKQLNEFMSANVNQDVLEFIAGNFTSDIRELEGAFNKVYAFSKAYQDISIDICKSTLFKDIIEDKKIVKNISIQKIIKIVAKYYNIDPELLTSTKRDQHIAFIRQLAMYLCKEICDYPYKYIGGEFEKDHSTVIHSYKKIQEMIGTDHLLLESINTIKKNILNFNDL